MAILGNPNLDVRKTNRAIDALLETTTNPRHRFLLQTYHRHRFLEIAGRYEEIFAPDMTVENPVYHFKAVGIDATLAGADAVQGLYGLWAQTSQSIFYVDREQVAVADHFIASVSDMYQQVHGSSLKANGADIEDEDAYYLIYVEGMQMFWPYDDRGRLVGEDVWEPNPAARKLIKLDPSDVVTTQQSGKLLADLILPLPAFDDSMLPGA